MTVFMIGSMLPDVLLRGGRLFFQGNPRQDFLELYIAPLHTPFACALICLGLAQLFDHKVRRTLFAFLYLGCVSHFILDLLQRTIVDTGLTVELIDGYRWLYPFSWFDFQIGLFWAEDSPYALFLLIPFTTWLYLVPRIGRLKGFSQRRWLERG
jgi:hypothetical protein